MLGNIDRIMLGKIGGNHKVYKQRWQHWKKLWRKKKISI